MLHKFRIASCAFILCLFGLTLITVSPVLAEDSAAFVECQQIKGDLKGKKNCFKRLARELEAAVNTAAKDLETLQAAADKAEADKVELQAALDNTEKRRRQGNLEYKGYTFKFISNATRTRENETESCSRKLRGCESDLEKARLCIAGGDCSGVK